MALDSSATIWSARLYEQYRQIPGLYRQLFEDVSSEIPYGEKLKITSIDQSSITISDYTSDADWSTDANTPSDHDFDLDLDQKKRFEIFIDRVTHKEIRPQIIDAYSLMAAEKMAAQIDSYCKGKILASGHIEVSSGFLFPASLNMLTDDNCEDIAEKLLEVLEKGDTNFWPSEGRVLVISPALKYALLKYMMKQGTSPSDRPEGGGLAQISSLVGYRALLDPTLDIPDTSGDTIAIAVNPQMGKFAQTISDVSVFEPEKRFGVAIKGLNVYGAVRTFNSASNSKGVVHLKAAT